MTFGLLSYLSDGRWIGLTVLQPCRRSFLARDVIICGAANATTQPQARNTTRGAGEESPSTHFEWLQAGFSFRTTLI